MGVSNKTPVQSRADRLLEINRQRFVPEVNSKIARGVSQYRRETLEGELNAGLFREQGQKTPFYGITEDSREKQTALGFVAGLSKNSNLFKTASSAGNLTSSSGGWRGSNNSVSQVPEVYSPLWLNSNLNLPRDRATINAWCRAYFALNPFVHNAISLHSTYPIAKLNIRCKDRNHEQFFKQMIEETDLMNICVMAAQEYWVLGEAFVYAELDEQSRKWSKFEVLNPDYVNVQRSVASADPIISMRPDENLRRIVNGSTPSDIQQRQQLSESIISHVRRNENIPLNNMNVSHIVRKIAPYEARGTGLCVTCFRALSLFDKLRESKYAQSDSFVNPLTLIKIGDADYKPTPVDLDHWRNIFEQAQNDKSFKIFTHNAVAVEPIGFGGAIYDTSGDIKQLIEEIFTGLMVPSVIMNGTDTTYATGSIALDVLRQRYMQFRNYMASWLRNKIFAPIAEMNDFYSYEGGKKVLSIPEIDWNHMSLFDMSDYINSLNQLAGDGKGTNRKISVQTQYRSLGLEYEDELIKMRYEDIQDAIREREIASLARFNLHELRSLGPGDEIEEVSEEPVPGQSPYISGQSGGEEGAPGGGLGDMGGGMPGPSNLGPMPGSPSPTPIGGGGPSGPPEAPKLSFHQQYKIIKNGRNKRLEEQNQPQM